MLRKLPDHIETIETISSKHSLTDHPHLHKIIKLMIEQKIEALEPGVYQLDNQLIQIPVFITKAKSSETFIVEQFVSEEAENNFTNKHQSAKRYSIDYKTKSIIEDELRTKKEKEKKVLALLVSTEQTPAIDIFEEDNKKYISYAENGKTNTFEIEQYEQDHFLIYVKDKQKYFVDLTIEEANISPIRDLKEEHKDLLFAKLKAAAKFDRCTVLPGTFHREGNKVIYIPSAIKVSSDPVTFLCESTFIGNEQVQYARLEADKLVIKPLSEKIESYEAHLKQFVYFLQTEVAPHVDAEVIFPEGKFVQENAASALTVTYPQVTAKKIKANGKEQTQFCLPYQGTNLYVLLDSTNNLINMQVDNVPVHFIDPLKPSPDQRFILAQLIETELEKNAAHRLTKEDIVHKKRPELSANKLYSLQLNGEKIYIYLKNTIVQVKANNRKQSSIQYRYQVLDASVAKERAGRSELVTAKKAVTGTDYKVKRSKRYAWILGGMFTLKTNSEPLLLTEEYGASAQTLFEEPTKQARLFTSVLYPEIKEEINFAKENFVGGTIQPGPDFGESLQTLKDNGYIESLNLNEKVALIESIMSAAHDMHRRGITHRNLTLENITYDRKKKIAHITNFTHASTVQQKEFKQGALEYLPPAEIIYQLNLENNLVKEEEKSKKKAAQNHNNNISLDIYSLGMIFDDILGGSKLEDKKKCIDQTRQTISQIESKQRVAYKARIEAEKEHEKLKTKETSHLFEQAKALYQKITKSESVEITSEIQTTSKALEALDASSLRVTASEDKRIDISRLELCIGKFIKPVDKDAYNPDYLAQELHGIASTYQLETFNERRSLGIQNKIINKLNKKIKKLTLEESKLKATELKAKNAIIEKKRILNHLIDDLVSPRNKGKSVETIIKQWECGHYVNVDGSIIPIKDTLDKARGLPTLKTSTRRLVTVLKNQFGNEVLFALPQTDLLLTSANLKEVFEKNVLYAQPLLKMLATHGEIHPNDYEIALSDGTKKIKVERSVTQIAETDDTFIYLWDDPIAPCYLTVSKPLSEASKVSVEPVKIKNYMLEMNVLAKIIEDKLAHADLTFLPSHMSHHYDPETGKVHRINLPTIEKRTAANGTYYHIGDRVNYMNFCVSNGKLSSPTEQQRVLMSRHSKFIEVIDPLNVEDHQHALLASLIEQTLEHYYTQEVKIEANKVYHVKINSKIHLVTLTQPILKLRQEEYLIGDTNRTALDGQTKTASHYAVFENKKFKVSTLNLPIHYQNFHDVEQAATAKHIFEMIHPGMSTAIMANNNKSNVLICQTGVGLKNLQTLIEEGLFQDEAKAKIAICAITHALSLMHEKGFVHGNLTANHIIYNPETHAVQFIGTHGTKLYFVDDFKLQEKSDPTTPEMAKAHSNNELMPSHHASLTNKGKMIIEKSSDVYQLGHIFKEILQDLPAPELNAYIEEMQHPIKDMRPSILDVTIEVDKVSEFITSADKAQAQDAIEKTMAELSKRISAREKSFSYIHTPILDLTPIHNQIQATLVSRAKDNLFMSAFVLPGNPPRLDLLNAKNDIEKRLGVTIEDALKNDQKAIRTYAAGNTEIHRILFEAISLIQHQLKLEEIEAFYDHFVSLHLKVEENLLLLDQQKINILQEQLQNLLSFPGVKQLEELIGTLSNNNVFPTNEAVAEIKSALTVAKKDETALKNGLFANWHQIQHLHQIRKISTGKYHDRMQLLKELKALILLPQNADVPLQDIVTHWEKGTFVNYRGLVKPIKDAIKASKNSLNFFGPKEKCLYQVINELKQINKVEKPRFDHRS